MTLSIEAFGDQLLRTQDLDPVYVAIDSANLDAPTMARLLISYWCVYHLGVAAKLAEIKQPKKFWDTLMAVAVNESKPNGDKPWPRGSERRHFRGQQAIDAVKELTAKYKTAEHALDGFIGASPFTYTSVSTAAQSHRGFGQWIAFKVADMCERVLALDVDFSDCELGIYKDPRQGAALAYLTWKEYTNAPAFQHGPKPYAGREWDYPISDNALRETVAHYVALWRGKRAKAPPRRDRLVTVQEIETIFCKYKSYYKGHYSVGKDVLEVQHVLQGWGDLAAQLRQGAPKWAASAT